jgi:endothelin-converting enzyme/putative endopeptidase
MNRRCCFALLVAACATSPATQTKKEPEVAGKSIEIADLDRSAAPCDDFFQFSNGAWRAANPIPASMQRWSRRWQAGEKNKEQLRDILEELSKGHWPQGSIEQQVVDHYASCMDQQAVDAAGIQPLAPLFAEIDAIQTAADVQKVIRHLHDLQVPVPFGFVSFPDQHQPTRTIALVFASGLGLPDRDYYVKTEPRFVETREKYRAHLQRVLELAKRPAPKESMEAIFALETRLAQNSLDNVALRNPYNTDHLMPYAELQKSSPHVDWNAYFDAAHLAHGDVNLAEPKFIEQVDRELQTLPIPAWRAYLSWQLIDSASPWLAKPFEDEWFAFNQTYLNGVKEMKPRSTRCAENTDALLGEALGRKYVERYFPPAAKARMTELVRNELAALKEIIEGLPWMGPETKKKALEKLSTFNPKIGYPDKWKDYSSVKIRRDSLWANEDAGRRFNVDDDRAQIGKPTDRGRWGMTPPTSNAYYNPLLNEIVFPAGILQPPMFDLANVDAVNYGSIGVVIGHEISHGFDDQGAQFDADGRLKNWWTEKDLQEFQKRAQCVVDQFEGYFIEPGIHHNGKLVLGESIGDLAGAKIAYRAYLKSWQGKPRPPDVDGFTPEQQFFIAWGQARGDAIRPETQRTMVQSDPHPIAKFRVIGPLSNIPEFGQAFSCKASSPMVREPRCEVW